MSVGDTKTADCKIHKGQVTTHGMLCLELPAQPTDSWTCQRVPSHQHCYLGLEGAGRTLVN